jgi:hypothetical protein
MQDNAYDRILQMLDLRSVRESRIDTIKMPAMIIIQLLGLPHLLHDTGGNLRLISSHLRNVLCEVSDSDTPLGTLLGSIPGSAPNCLVLIP